MAYISSNNNRWYCQLENSYGKVPSITASNRIPAVKMSVQQKVETPKRQDKTGTRTFPGALANMRKQTKFDVTTYMTSWTTPGTAPAYGPLFQATLGGSPLYFNGGTAASTASSSNILIAFESNHGLAVQQAVTFLGEIRFVSVVIDSLTVVLNAPFSTMPTQGTAIGPTVTYLPATELPSVSIFDYWTPSTSVQRLLCGCGVDGFELQVNGDYQQFEFKGMAQDVLDSESFAFVPDNGGLSAFPAEPAVGTGPTTIVPGHLGQVWFTGSQFLSLTSAKLILQNALDMRTHEFGSIVPKEINPGLRSVLLDMELFGQDDAPTLSLYQSARQRTPIGVGIQLGQTTGQLLGVYMQSVVPEVPDYDDKENRLQWQFRGSQAQGLGNDEVVVAFG